MPHVVVVITKVCVCVVLLVITVVVGVGVLPTLFWAVTARYRRQVCPRCGEKQLEVGGHTELLSAKFQARWIAEKTCHACGYKRSEAQPWHGAEYDFP